jgi:hypothetical protein
VKHFSPCFWASLDAGNMKKGQIPPVVQLKRSVRKESGPCLAGSDGSAHGHVEAKLKHAAMELV